MLEILTWALFGDNGKLFLEVCVLLYILVVFFPSSCLPQKMAGFFSSSFFKWMGNIPKDHRIFQIEIVHIPHLYVFPHDEDLHDYLSD